jgi:hypothetical protein
MAVILGKRFISRNGLGKYVIFRVLGNAVGNFCRAGARRVAVPAASTKAVVLSPSGPRYAASMAYQGSCHCGRVAFEVEGDVAQAIECNCSHCSRKGYLLWFAPRAALQLSTPESALGTYTFNKHVIQHHFCTTCGCAPFGFGVDPRGKATVAVNVRCLEGVDLTTLKRMPFDGRSK